MLPAILVSASTSVKTRHREFLGDINACMRLGKASVLVNWHEGTQKWANTRWAKHGELSSNYPRSPFGDELPMLYGSTPLRWTSLFHSNLGARINCC